MFLVLRDAKTASCGKRYGCTPVGLPVAGSARAFEQLGGQRLQIVPRARWFERREEPPIERAPGRVLAARAAGDGQQRLVSALGQAGRGQRDVIEKGAQQLAVGARVVVASVERQEKTSDPVGALALAPARR